MRIAGLIYDDSAHYLDHLGPCCALLKCPLILCEPSLAELARYYYPDLEVLGIPLWELKLPKTVLSCDSQPILQAAFPSQKTQSIWLPHGNSDKGWGGAYARTLDHEKASLVYGQKIIDFLSPPNPIRIGNFRREYSLKHKPFFPLPEGDKFLYAPTWDDDNSFWKAFDSLALQLPDTAHLLVKLHPNTLRKFEPEIEILKGRYAKRKNIHFLPNIPPIYPLLEQCSAYIGDMSSIGYDFLSFDRPLYFLHANPILPLHQCGSPIDPKTFSYSLKNAFSAEKKALYQYTFDPSPDWKIIKEQIDALCSV